jgi:hypothetical protein
MGQKLSSNKNKNKIKIAKKIESKCDIDLINKIKFRLICMEKFTDNKCDDMCCVCYETKDLTRPLKPSSGRDKKSLFACQHVVCVWCQTKLFKKECPLCCKPIDVLPFYKKFCVIVPYEIDRIIYKKKSIIIASKLGILYYPNIICNDLKTKKCELVHNINSIDKFLYITLVLYLDALFRFLTKENYIIIYHTHEIITNTFELIKFNPINNIIIKL